MRQGVIWEAATPPQSKSWLFSGQLLSATTHFTISSCMPMGTLIVFFLLDFNHFILFQNRKVFKLSMKLFVQNRTFKIKTHINIFIERKYVFNWWAEERNRNQDFRRLVLSTLFHFYLTRMLNRKNNINYQILMMFLKHIWSNVVRRHLLFALNKVNADKMHQV